MSESIDTLWHAHILSAQIAPNPAEAGAALVIQVRALDVFGGRQAETWTSGELLSGEV